MVLLKASAPPAAVFGVSVLSQHSQQHFPCSLPFGWSSSTAVSGLLPHLRVGKGAAREAPCQAGLSGEGLRPGPGGAAG